MTSGGLRNLAIAVLVVVAAFAIASYVSGRPSRELNDQDRRLAAAISVDLSTNEPGDPPVAFPEDDAVCIAREILLEVPAARMAELGISVESVQILGFEPSSVPFTEAEVESIVSGFEACVDLLEAAVDGLTVNRGEAVRNCVERGLGADGARDLWLWRTGQGGEEVPAELAAPLDAVDRCLG